MKKVININFQGRVVPIEEVAYDILQDYIESLNNYFANEEGKNEIINDIESRIAELFAEVLKKGATCVTEADVNNIITSMGRPEDFDDEEASLQQQLGKDKKSNTNTSNESNTTADAAFTGYKRLYRDENNKFIAGVCSGIANYFNTDPVIIRIIFIIAFFTFGIALLPYIILWVAVPSTATKQIGSFRKRLFRDTENKVVGGVASGLGHYFGINPWIPRVIFLVPFLSFAFRWRHWDWFDYPDFINFSFSPGAFVTYVVLWIILPEAITSADKLEMKGERVDLNSIKQTIQNDMDGFKGRAEKAGEDLKAQAEKITKEFNQQYGKKTSNGIARIFTILIKAFVYFILGIVLFSIVVSLFAAGVALTGLIPASAYILHEGWQTVLAWATLICGIWVPVIAILVWAFRKITGAKTNKIITLTFSALWTIGFISLIFLIASLSKDFRYTNTSTEETFYLPNPKVDKLEVTIEGFNFDKYEDNWLDIEPFETLVGDSCYIPNASIQITKSTTDSFQVTVIKRSNGRTKQQANELADKITYTIAQKDSILAMYKGLVINKKDKFRNQRVRIIIAVPVGKRIFIDDRIGWKHEITFGNNDWNRRRRDIFSDQGYDYNTNVEYIMTEKGLEKIRKNKYSYNDGDGNNENDIKEELNDLQNEVEEKQREINRKKRSLDKYGNDSTAPKYKYQKTASIAPVETNNLLPIEAEEKFSTLLDS
jgi:phage shock protein PspC (stress-responsive transcriptional regulator)